jgi:hypothetical protein
VKPFCAISACIFSVKRLRVSRGTEKYRSKCPRHTAFTLSCTTRSRVRWLILPLPDDHGDAQSSSDSSSRRSWGIAPNLQSAFGPPFLQVLACGNIHQRGWCSRDATAARTKARLVEIVVAASAGPRRALWRLGRRFLFRAHPGTRVAQAIAGSCLLIRGQLTVDVASDSAGP